jgi:hypothetical protein
MGGTPNLICSPTSWQGRKAYALENDLVRLVILRGGGHVAEFRFRERPRVCSLNPLWLPPWKTIEPYHYRASIHQARYGAPLTGKMLSGIVGHNICLDYFGLPSEEEVKHGLSIHGEAPSSRWRKVRARAASRSARLELSTSLPIAGIRLNRELEIKRGESVVYFREMVMNERKADHFFHWTQHVTLGPPFLHHEESRMFVSGSRGRTFPHGYENKALLKSSQDFRWPNAPGIAGGSVNLSRPFIRAGAGFVVAILLDPRRDVEFVGALNKKTHLFVGYCFRRRDFPWVTIWEENKARTDVPWSGRCQARGLEFGSTPFPVLRREAFTSGPLFGAPCFSMVAARSHKKVSYVSFLAQLPSGVDDVRDVSLAPGEIRILARRSSNGRAETVRLPASGLGVIGLV